MDLKEKQLAIIQHYGTDKQLDLLIEECGELIQAICKFKRSKLTEKGIEWSYNLAEEIADVENVIEQFKLNQPEMVNLINIIKENKASRQMVRIEGPANLFPVETTLRVVK